MMNRILYLILFLSTVSLNAQQHNVKLIAHEPLDSSFGRASDIWAYIAPNGHEYAAMGVFTGTVIYDLADPSNPRELVKIDGALSNWRDIKHYKEKIYAVTEGVSDSALLVIDMSLAPDSISWKYIEINSSLSNSKVTNCHNFYIDTLGLMYLTGCNTNNGATLIYDINDSIPVPIPVRGELWGSTHDVFARDSIIYLSNINYGDLTIHDISDPENPILLSVFETKATRTHNAWLSDDNNYIFTTDETSRGGVDAYDISDFDNIEFLDTYKPKSEQRFSIPHNTHYYNGYLVTSYYGHGIRIIDAHRPSNLIEVGFYQTGTDSLSANCWGATPFLPSNLIIGSDIYNGLFVLRPKYERASYLEGFVKSSLDSTGINNAIITIQDSYANQDSSIFDGAFKTGLVKEGEFQVLFQHPEYYDTTFTINLETANVTELTAFMRPKEVYNIKAEIINEKTLDPLDSVIVEIYRPPFFESSFTDSLGIFSFDFVFGILEILNGKWGYEFSQKFINLNSNQDIEIPLAPKYEDNFYFDLGWNQKSLNSAWRKSRFIFDNSGNTIIGPGEDSADFGNEAYTMVYRNSDFNPQLSELISPNINLLTYIEPILNFEYFSFLRPMEEDSAGGFHFGFYKNGHKIYIDTLPNNITSWTPKQVEISDYIELSDSINVFFEIATNRSGTLNLLYQAGIDNFSISEGNPTIVNELEFSDLNIQVFPNPFNQIITIESSETKLYGPNLAIHLYDLLGHRIKSYDGIPFNGKLDLKIPDLYSGIYIIRIQQGDLFSKALKLLKI